MTDLDTLCSQEATSKYQFIAFIERKRKEEKVAGKKTQKKMCADLRFGDCAALEWIRYMEELNCTCMYVGSSYPKESLYKSREYLEDEAEAGFSET